MIGVSRSDSGFLLAPVAQAGDAGTKTLSGSIVAPLNQRQLGQGSSLVVATTILSRPGERAKALSPPSTLDVSDLHADCQRTLITCLRRAIAFLCVLSMLSACSSSGGIYKEGDPKNGEFSALNTFLLPFAIAGAVLVGAAVASTPPENPRIYYSPQYGYFCANANNGQPLPKWKCGG